MVWGGRMCLVFRGRTSGEHELIHPGFESLEITLNDLVSQGLIEEEKVDSFNLPLFGPCREEVRNEIVSEGSFEIHRLEFLPNAEITKEDMGVLSDSARAKEAYGKIIAKQTMATMESLLKYHFGDDVMEALFHRYGERMGERMSELTEYRWKVGLMAIVLERK